MKIHEEKIRTAFISSSFTPSFPRRQESHGADRWVEEIPAFAGMTDSVGVTE